MSPLTQSKKAIASHLSFAQELKKRNRLGGLSQQETVKFTSGILV
jgi:hypothetical protein